MKGEKAWEYVGKEENKPMTLAFAKRIKKYRIEQGNSWRGVAYEVTNGETSNQILGMFLCEKAMKFLKENNQDGWN